MGQSRSSRTNCSPGTCTFPCSKQDPLEETHVVEIDLLMFSCIALTPLCGPRTHEFRWFSTSNAGADGDKDSLAATVRNPAHAD
jgi:hypothetical protein